MYNIVEDLEEVLDATANLSLPAARAWRAEFRAAKQKVERENPNMASGFQVRLWLVGDLRTQVGVVFSQDCAAQLS